MIIIEREVMDETGNIKLEKNPVHTKASIKQYVRSYQVNRGEVELLYSCTSNLCHGRGYYSIQKPNGLWETLTCTCVDKVLEKIK